jgi:hypothetical protein
MTESLVAEVARDETNLTKTVASTCAISFEIDELALSRGLVFPMGRRPATNWWPTPFKSAARSMNFGEQGSSAGR